MEYKRREEPVVYEPFWKVGIKPAWKEVNNITKQRLTTIAVTIYPALILMKYFPIEKIHM